MSTTYHKPPVKTIALGKQMQVIWKDFKLIYRRRKQLLCNSYMVLDWSDSTLVWEQYKFTPP